MSDVHPTEGRFYFNLLIGGISLYSLTNLCKFSLEAYHRKHEIIRAEKAKVYTPDHLLEKIRKHTHHLTELKKLKNFTFTNKERTEIKGRVFLTGLIKCDQPIASTTHAGYMYKQNLIYRILFEEEKYSLDPKDVPFKSYKMSDFPSNSTFEKVPKFQLADPKTGTLCQVRVHEGFDMNRCVQVIGENSSKISVSFTQRIAGFFIMLVKLICDLFYGSNTPIRGIRLGLSQKELGIKVDTFTNVFGEIFFDLETGKLRFELPDALINDKGHFITKLKEELAKTRYLRNVSAVVFVGTLAYFARRLFLYKKRNENKWKNPFAQFFN